MVHGLEEGASTRVLIYAGRLIKEGIPSRRACQVAVTWGIRSKLGVLIAGVSLAVFPVIIANLLSLQTAKLVPALFGLGAIQLAKEPRGIVVMNVEQFRRLRRRLSSRQRAPEPATAA